MQKNMQKTYDKMITIKALVEEKGLCLMNDSIDLSLLYIKTPDLNRLGLQLTGFFEKLDTERIQIIGEAEKTYLDTLTQERKIDIYNELASLNIPCIVYTKNIVPDKEAIRIFTHKNIPILGTSDSTSTIIAELTRYLKVELAPSVTMHGVLVDVYGEGVLIIGESGIGKSEAALELIQRGHRLVSDDSVEISKVSEVTLLGKSPYVTKGMLEVRGIGIIDIMRCYGTQSVLEKQNINMIINLVEWKDGMNYDRLGESINTTEILGNVVDYYEIPIRSGRNIAIIVEACAVNHRSRLMGFNPMKLIERRMEERKEKKSNRRIKC